MFVSHGSWNLITKVHISHFLLYSTINSPMYVIFFYLMRSVQYFDTFFGFIQSSLFHSINIPTSINGKFPGNWTLIWLEPCLLVIFGTFSLQNIGFFCLYSHYFINEALHLRFKCVVMCVCVCIYCTSPEIWQWLHMLFPGCLYFQVLWRSPYIRWKTDTSIKNLKVQIITEWTSRVCERSEQTCLAVFWSPVLW